MMAASHPFNPSVFASLASCCPSIFTLPYPPPAVKPVEETKMTELANSFPFTVEVRKRMGWHGADALKDWKMSSEDAEMMRRVADPSKATTTVAYSEQLPDGSWCAAPASSPLAVGQLVKYLDFGTYIIKSISGHLAMLEDEKYGTPTQGYLSHLTPMPAAAPQSVGERTASDDAKAMIAKMDAEVAAKVKALTQSVGERMAKAAFSSFMNCTSEFAVKKSAMLIDAAIAEERENCAKVAEETHSNAAAYMIRFRARK